MDHQAMTWLDDWIRKFEEIERQKVAALREIARRPPATETGETAYDEEYERWWEK